MRDIVGFIGLAGPYHLADHYQFERNRVLGPIKGKYAVA